ncbi:hypothetical protein KEJ27_10160, partial [Candidatus Bathyarchaeota archaeon]|nr:hypothetical protein [Candidatus Bathyarchaeota archaeon]
RRKKRKILMEILKLVRESSFYDKSMREWVLLNGVKNFLQGEVLYSFSSKYENPLYLKLLKSVFEDSRFGDSSSNNER